MQRLGPYELLNELGRGAMGVVYRARHRATGAERALKVIDSGSVDSEGLARFKREAEALARVDRHPNLVRVHESGTEGRVWFYAMELVRGVSLRKLLEKGPLPTEHAVELAAKLGRALAHCHANGVIHRDVKPDNVLVDEHGEPRLVDFGLVRDLYKNRLTRTGDYLGTPAYMASEQIKGEAATAETDIYALAVVTFEILTGRRPYSATNVHDLSAQIIDGDSSTLAALAPELPERLSRLLERCLVPERRDRPKSALIVAVQLEEVLEGLRTRTIVPARSVNRLKYGLVALLAVALALGLASVGVLVQRRLAANAAARELIVRRHAASGLAHAARVHGEGRLPDAALLAVAAHALDESLPVSARDTRTATDLALANAWTSVAEDPASALAAVTSAAASFGANAPEQRELEQVRALALLGQGDSDGALVALAKLEGADALHTRAHLLLALERWREIDALSPEDHVVAAIQAWSIWARVPQVLPPEVEDMAEIAPADLAEPANGEPSKEKEPEVKSSVPPRPADTRASEALAKLRLLPPGVQDEFRLALEIAVAREPILAWDALSGPERFLRERTDFNIFLRYAMVVEDAWSKGPVAHVVPERQLEDLVHALGAFHHKGFQKWRNQSERYLPTIDHFASAGKLVAHGLPKPELACAPLDLAVAFVRMQVLFDGNGVTPTATESLRRINRSNIDRLGDMTPSFPPDLVTSVRELILYDTENLMGGREPLSTEDLTRYLHDLEGVIDAEAKARRAKNGLVMHERSTFESTHRQRRAASVCVRLASRSSDEAEKARLFAKAEAFIAFSRSKVSPKDSDQLRAVEHEAYYLAMTRGDEAEAQRAQAAFRLDTPEDHSLFDQPLTFVENVLVAAHARLLNDEAGAKRYFTQAVAVYRQAAHGRDVHGDDWYGFLLKYAN